MKRKSRVELEREYHESEDQARQGSRLIRGVYGSRVFDEAMSYHQDVLGDIAGLQVLDYGCGGGYDSARLRAQGALVTAFDISTTRLAEAQGHLSRNEAGAPVVLIQCAAGRLPFVDASFDAVFGKWVLHHLDLDEDLPEIVRVLKPGGKAAFVEPLIHNPILQTYRRLTPHLRSPDERALSMEDLAKVGSHFRKWEHKEFVFLSVLPALASALFPGRLASLGVRGWLKRVDRVSMLAASIKGCRELGAWSGETQRLEAKHEDVGRVAR